MTWSIKRDNLSVGTETSVTSMGSFNAVLIVLRPWKGVISLMFSIKFLFNICTGTVVIYNKMEWRRFGLHAETAVVLSISVLKLMFGPEKMLSVISLKSTISMLSEIFLRSIIYLYLSLWLFLYFMILPWLCCRPLPFSDGSNEAGGRVVFRVAGAVHLSVYLVDVCSSCASSSFVPLLYGSV